MKGVSEDKLIKMSEDRLIWSEFPAHFGELEDKERIDRIKVIEDFLRKVKVEYAIREIDECDFLDKTSKIA